MPLDFSGVLAFSSQSSGFFGIGRLTPSRYERLS
jgi:hypothetical protein